MKYINGFFIVIAANFIFNVSHAKDLVSDLLLEGDKTRYNSDSIYQWEEWSQWESILADRCSKEEDQNFLIGPCNDSIGELQTIGDRYSKIAIARAYYLLASSSDTPDSSSYLEKEIAIYEGLLRENSEDTYALFQLALTMSDEKKFRQTLTRILEIDADMSGALWQLGKSYQESFSEKDRKIASSYFLKAYLVGIDSGIVYVGYAEEYYHSLIENNKIEEAKNFLAEVLNDLNLSSLLSSFKKLDLSDNSNLKKSLNTLLVACDVRLVRSLGHNSSCQDTLEHISNFKKPDLKLLSQSIVTAQSALGQELLYVSKTNKNASITEKLYLSYLEQSEDDIKIWYEYAYYFLDDEKKKEVYEKVITAEQDVPPYSWYNLADIYISQGNTKNGLKYLQIGLERVPLKDKPIYQMKIDELRSG